MSDGWKCTNQLRLVSHPTNDDAFRQILQQLWIHGTKESGYSREWQNVDIIYWRSAEGYKGDEK